MLLSRITDVICNCPIDWSMISMCGHQVTDWIQLTVAWSRISRWFCCLLILMFSWTMVFYMVFKLSTIIESDQKHFLHSRMWVFVAWCMSCGLWHSSPAHIFYWNGVPRPRYGSAQCSMAVKLLNDLGRLNSLWRRNQYGEAGILPHVNAILVFLKDKCQHWTWQPCSRKACKRGSTARPPTHPPQKTQTSVLKKALLPFGDEQPSPAQKSCRHRH